MDTHPPHIAAPLATERGRTPAEATASVGPGWYQSSWELRCGLQVNEGVALEEPLQEWLLQCGQQKA